MMIEPGRKRRVSGHGMGGWGGGWVTIHKRKKQQCTLTQRGEPSGQSPVHPHARPCLPSTPRRKSLYAIDMRLVRGLWWRAYASWIAQPNAAPPTAKKARNRVCLPDTTRTARNQTRTHGSTPAHRPRLRRRKTHRTRTRLLPCNLHVRRGARCCHWRLWLTLAANSAWHDTSSRPCA